jgi:predicted membrane protein
VLGLGMVWGSFVNGGRGLIGWAVPLAVVGIALTVVSPNGWQGVGEIIERPATTADVQRHYNRSAGRVELDLHSLPDQGTVHTSVSVGAGDIEVILPRHADVEVTCRANVGDVTCLGRNESGPDSEITVPEDGDSGADGLRIKLDVDAGVGSVEVRRG